MRQWRATSTPFRSKKRQRDWLGKFPGGVKECLLEKHGRNGLVEKSWSSPLGTLQDMGSSRRFR